MPARTPQPGRHHRGPPPLRGGPQLPRRPPRAPPRRSGGLRPTTSPPPSRTRTSGSGLRPSPWSGLIPGGPAPRPAAPPPPPPPPPGPPERAGGRGRNDFRVTGWADRAEPVGGWSVRRAPRPVEAGPPGAPGTGPCPARHSASGGTEGGPARGFGRGFTMGIGAGCAGHHGHPGGRGGILGGGRALLGQGPTAAPTASVPGTRATLPASDLPHRLARERPRSRRRLHRDPHREGPDRARPRLRPPAGSAPTRRSATATPTSLFSWRGRCRTGPPRSAS